MAAAATWLRSFDVWALNPFDWRTWCPICLYSPQWRTEKSRLRRPPVLPVPFEAARVELTRISGRLYRYRKTSVHLFVALLTAAVWLLPKAGAALP